METRMIPAYSHIDEIKNLFVQYAEWLGISLHFQNFEQEIASLPRQYKMPEGRLFLLLADGKPAGCIALRYFDTVENGKKRCEMKRLYIKKEYQGHGFGKTLVGHIIMEAKTIGYTEMLLDTFSFMEHAISIYQKFGFQETAPYRYNPHTNVKYLKLIL